MVELREIGKGPGVYINPIGLGCMGMSYLYGPSESEEASFKVLDRAIELNFNFWNTADVYVQDPDTPNKLIGVDGKRYYVRQCCENSLERLDVNITDLYHQHRPDPKTPIEETIKAMAEWGKEGKIRYGGLSECNSETLRRAYAIHPITAVQMEYSPWTLDIETNGILETARELGVTIAIYSPLGRKFLTGTIKSPNDLTENDISTFLS
ncbi:NADP-dependent oxidoreductase domain-containing protein [Circinella umbellata]|nr:NADP-dependent oxidoreductase domain-containing protein [Circinella umbellata]